MTSRRPPVRVFLVDDHALFRSGVRAELARRARTSTVVGEAGSVGRGGRRGSRHLQPGRGAARRAHARRRRPRGAATRSGPQQPDVVFLALSRVRRRRGRHRRDPGRRPRLRHQDDLRPGAGRRRPPGGGRRRGVLAAAGRVRAGRVLRPARRRAARPTPSWTSSPAASARCCGCWPAATPTRRSRRELFISIKTVETHVSSVLRKTQMSNRYELSRWAADRRLV